MRSAMAFTYRPVKNESEIAPLILASFKMKGTNTRWEIGLSLHCSCINCSSDSVSEAYFRLFPVVSLEQIPFVSIVIVRHFFTQFGYKKIDRFRIGEEMSALSHYQATKSSISLVPT
jgi:hypothetical protein